MLVSGQNNRRCVSTLTLQAKRCGKGIPAKLAAAYGGSRPPHPPRLERLVCYQLYSRLIDDLAEKNPSWTCGRRLSLHELRGYQTGRKNLAVVFYEDAVGLPLTGIVHGASPTPIGTG